MTPTTPPAIPSDIPADLLAIAEGIAAQIPRRVQPINRDFAADVIARALLAAQERGKLMERERLTDPAFLQTCLTNVIPGFVQWVA